MKGLTVLFLVLALLVSGCNPKFSANTTITTIQAFSEELPKEVAGLPLLDMSSVESFEKYGEFADAVNVLIKVLNEKGDRIFNIPQLEVTMDSYQKLSRAVTEYGPLIKNYNDLINSAREVEQGKTGIKEFYQASAIFGLEFAVIYGTVFYAPSYETVGIVYRAVELNRLAFKCGPCIAFILSKAHWAIRTALVEESSKGAEALIDLVGKVYKTGTSLSLDGASEFLKKYSGGK